VDAAIEAVTKKGGRLAAICAAPLILGKRGLLAGKHAVCYPGFEHELCGAIVSETAGVVTDGNITTAKGMGVAFEFGIELVRLLFGKEKADALTKGTVRPFAEAIEIHP
jgi:4-methyl-5(b-hydroxyethyl)-thiazole monophosphate biosynthesis